MHGAPKKLKVKVCHITKRGTKVLGCYVRTGPKGEYEVRKSQRMRLTRREMRHSGDVLGDDEFSEEAQAAEEERDEADAGIEEEELIKRAKD